MKSQAVYLPRIILCIKPLLSATNKLLEDKSDKYLTKLISVLHTSSISITILFLIISKIQIFPHA
jgi:hypothetical protein